MPLDSYPCIYEDTHGREETFIHNDGTELKLSVRGITFVGTDFDCLSPVDTEPALAESRFTLQQGDLCSCTLQWTMPVTLEVDGERLPHPLVATLILGEPSANGCLSREDLQLELQTADGPIRSSGSSGWFEGELLEITSLLGARTRLRACITCAFSDYSPYGHGLFGDLACFRNTKDDYRRVKSKHGIFALWNRMTEYVQETHVCGEHAHRPPGTGYRG